MREMPNVTPNGVVDFFRSFKGGLVEFDKSSPAGLRYVTYQEGKAPEYAQKTSVSRMRDVFEAALLKAFLEGDHTSVKALQVHAPFRNIDRGYISTTVVKIDKLALALISTGEIPLPPFLTDGLTTAPMRYDRDPEERGARAHANFVQFLAQHGLNPPSSTPSIEKAYPGRPPLGARRRALGERNLNIALS